MVIRNVNVANTPVNKISFVSVPWNGKNGTNPNILPSQIKKNTVNKYGMYFWYFFSPILGIAISSRTKIISGSKKPAIPLGALLFFLYELAIGIKTNSIIIAVIINVKTFLVMEKLSGLLLVTVPSPSKDTVPLASA